MKSLGQKVNPVEVAKKIVAKFEKNDLIEKVKFNFLILILLIHYYLIFFLVRS